jgi:hypothetical protein
MAQHRLLEYGSGMSVGIAVKREHFEWRWFLDLWDEKNRVWTREATSMRQSDFDTAVADAAHLRGRAAEYRPQELENHRWGVEKVKTTVEIVEMREVT